MHVELSSVDRYDSSVSITGLSDTRTHLQNHKSAHTLARSTHTHTCTSIYIYMYWKREFSVAVVSITMFFCNTVPFHITPGLAAVLTFSHMVRARLCLSVCEGKTSECLGVGMINLRVVMKWCVGRKEKDRQALQKGRVYNTRRRVHSYKPETELNPFDQQAGNSQMF